MANQLTSSQGSRRRPQDTSINPIIWIVLGALIAVSLGISSCASTPIIYQSVVPDAVAPGGPAFTITVNGDQFTSGSTIDWNGTPLTGLTISGTQITATVPASLIAKPGTAAISVLSGSGGGTSNVIYFPVWNSATTASFVTASGSPIMVGVNPSAVVVADFNGDGKPDLAVANAKDGTVTVLLGNGDGTFTAAAGSPIAVGAGPDALAVGDFNVDGIQDLAVANGIAGTITVLIGKGDGTFKATVASPITVGTDPDALAVGDFNGNGDPGIVVANSGSNNIMYLQGNGDGTFKGPVSTAVGTAPSALAVGDFIGSYNTTTSTSGYLSLAVANAGSNNVTILLGAGNGTFKAATGSPIAVGNVPSALVVADLNRDGILDVAVANRGSNNVTTLLGNGDGTFAAAGSPIAVGTSPSALAVADFNADNKLDLVVANSGDSTATVLLGTGTGGFTPTTALPATGIGPAGLAVADFNRDGRLDIATADGTANTATVLLQPVAIISSATSLTYVQQGLGSTSAAQTVTLTNNTSTAVNFTTIGVTGTGSADFAAPAGGSTCSTTTPLAAGGGTCTINVTFTPLTAGSLTAALSITTNSPVTPSLSVQLSGTGFNGGEVALGPNSFSFPLQRVNTTSNAQIATLTNVGTFAVNISSITTSLSEYTIVPPTTGGTACLSLVGSSLAIGAQCVIPVTFTPNAAGTFAGSLNITDDAALSPQVVMLTGVGTNVQFAPTSLSFGSEPIGTASPTQTVTLTDVGASPLKISGITATAQFSVQYSVVSTTTCSTSVPLAAGASCNISLAFTPTQAGNITGSLFIADDDPSSPQQVGLAGVGQDFGVQSFTTTQTVKAGSPANYLLKVTPAFGFNGSVTMACTGAPTNATCAASPTSVKLNGVDYAAPSLQVATSALSLISPRAFPPASGRWPWMVGLMLLGLAGVLLLKSSGSKGEAMAPLWRWGRLASITLALLMLMLWASCGGGVTQSQAPANYGTPTGTYTLTVTASAGTLSHSTTVQLIVQ
jgi:hypothetical protein